MISNTVEGWTAGFIAYFRAHPTLTGAIFIVTVGISLGGLIFMPIVIARMRSDHFVRPSPDTDSWFGRHPVARVAGLVAKNLVGVLLVVAGVAMLVLPGQGIVTILVGTSLLNFPGKRRLELYIVRQRHVQKAINWIRKRAKRPPLIIPPKGGDG